MAHVVFISHSGADSSKAANVAGQLKDAGISVRLDRQELALGDSFLSFMESALSDSDYCLLLWSLSASTTRWVTLEWEAALYRSVSENRSFLIAGRLEDVPLPALLGPRLRVDLFPDWQPGMGQLIGTWQSDRAAEQKTQRPVAGGATALSEEPDETSTIYLTSELFAITVPLKVDLDAPAGLYLDRVIRSFDLPIELGYKGRSGVRYSYRLMHDEFALNRNVSLASQGIQNKSILWLETTITPYSQSGPLRGSLNYGVYRSSEDLPDRREDDPTTLVRIAQRELLRAIVESGLGP